MKFRNDINGLRAIAVIAVVLFHFNPTWLPGGFAGVDVFFVISGFLMTGIIFRGLENNTFSIITFYRARANRILPALVFLCLALLFFGWGSLFSLEYKILVKHILSSLSFLSNIIYWSESGYFDAASHEKWLLHTWSLSAEWQFYIIYPLVLVAMKRLMSFHSMKLTILVSTILCFIFGVIATYKWTGAAYYLLPTRMWEMMLGGLAYLFPFNIKGKNKIRLEAIGFIFILATYIFISKDDLWPGYLSLLPVTGAFFIIQAQRNESLLTSNTIFVNLGLWSYSIYLWHWPIVVAIYNGYFESKLFGIILSVLLGFISYKYIERLKFNSNIFITFVLVTISGLFLYSKSLETFDSRPITKSDKAIFLKKSEEELLDLKINYHRPECNFKAYDKDKKKDIYKGFIDKSCITKKKKNSILIWGDSHAQHLYYGLNKQLKNEDIDILQVATFSCRVHNKTTDKACLESNKFIWDNLKKINPDILMISQRNEFEKIDFDKYIKKINSLGIKNIIVVGPSPEFNPTLSKLIVSEHWDSNERYITPSNLDELKNDNLMKEKLAQFERVTYISMFDKLCIDNKCLAVLNKDKEIIMVDAGHFSKKGSSFIASTILSPVIHRTLI